MASKTKRITIERHSITRIRISGKYRFVFCQVCQSETLAFTPEQTGKFLQISEAEVLQQVKLGEFHLVDEKGFALICGISLEGKNKFDEKL